MFGISYNAWKETCEMYFSLKLETVKSYLQWFPFSKLTDADKNWIKGEEFYRKYIETGGLVFFPEVMRHSDNYIQKSDGSFRSAALVSPFFYLVLQAAGKEISEKYVSQRPEDIEVYYAGNYEMRRPKYNKEYDRFYKTINDAADQYHYFIKTDITNFFGSINVNELIERMNEICNKESQTISQTQLLLLKEILLYSGNGYFPLIENSMASSYMATVIYLDEIDCELYRFLQSKVEDIVSFKMIRYVDDLYILFSSEKSINELTSIFNIVRNAYSSILKKHDLALNTKKYVLKETIDINEELKKSLYDEHVNGIETNMGEFFKGKLLDFLVDINNTVREHGLTNDRYNKLVDKHFSVENIEFTPEEVFNYLVYEDQTELKQIEVTNILVEIINEDISFLSIDPKRLSVMVMQCGNDRAIKAMLNQLFIRSRKGVWNSYDTTVAIAYLIQSKFQHKDLLKVINQNCPELFAYYYYGCRTSCICQVHDTKPERCLGCIEKDTKAAFLYFMSLCEKNRRNYLGAYAYYKNYFDRISADMAFLAGVDPKYKKPNYNIYYTKNNLQRLYNQIPNSRIILENAHNLRNENPLSHASAQLIDKDSSSKDLEDVQKELDNLINQFAERNKL